MNVGRERGERCINHLVGSERVRGGVTRVWIVGPLFVTFVGSSFGVWICREGHRTLFFFFFFLAYNKV